MTKLDLVDPGRSSATVAESHEEQKEGPQLEEASVIVQVGRTGKTVELDASPPASQERCSTWWA